MAIYSLNLKSIGRTTHAAGTAGAHLRYIARPDAQPELMSSNMPANATEARTWMNRAEESDRKNARVIDKVRIALPRELTPEQRIELVQGFAKEITGGNRVPWFAAIHAEGKDAHNPHCHLVIRDRDIETGKRVVKLSDSARDRKKAGLEPKAVEWVRTLWEEHGNRALERAGHEVRIDRRSLEAQGIDREPTIHIGPQAQHIDNFVERPQSKIVETGNGRSINYPMIDAGRTRQERNAEIIDLNLEKAARSPDFRTRETARFEREQRAKDTALENRLIAEARCRTLEERRYKARMRSELAENGERKAIEQDTLKSALKKVWTKGRQSLKERHRADTEALSKDQGRFSSRFMRAVDITGRTRKRQEEEKKALQEKQKRDRERFLQRYRRTRDAQKAAIAGRYRDVRKEVMGRLAPNLRDMRSRHKDGEDQADRLRQARATERTQAEEQFEDRMKAMTKQQQSPARRGPTFER